MNITELGQCYAAGTAYYKGSSIARNHIRAINILIYAQTHGWTDSMKLKLAELKKEADNLVQDYDALDEYARVRNDVKLRSFNKEES